jgi:hypothetical protein
VLADIGLLRLNFVADPTQNLVWLSLVVALEWFHLYFDEAAEEYRQLMAFFEQAVGDARTIRCSCGQDHDTGIHVPSGGDPATHDASSWVGFHEIRFAPRG